MGRCVPAVAQPPALAAPSISSAIVVTIERGRRIVMIIGDGKRAVQIALNISLHASYGAAALDTSTVVMHTSEQAAALGRYPDRRDGTDASAECVV